MADMFDEAKKYQNMPKEPDMFDRELETMGNRNNEPDMFDMYLADYRAKREEEKKRQQQREQLERKATRTPDTLSDCGYLTYKMWGGF